MSKIVLNTDYGYFGLSAKAIKRYFEIINPELPLFFYAIDYHDPDINGNCIVYSQVNPENIKDESYCILNKDFGTDLHFQAWNDPMIPWTSVDFVSCTPDRTDPALIQVVEELGGDSFGVAAYLEIIEFEGDLYYIEDDDGYESLFTPDTIQWQRVMKAR